MKKFVVWFKDTSIKDAGLVGGKIASLGEMLQKVKVPIPDGFAITSEAYKYFIQKACIEDEIKNLLESLDKDKYSVKNLKKIGSKIRKLIVDSELPEDLKKEIMEFYKKMGKPYVAVRSSATAEDLPSASFAGMQETFLNVKDDEILDAVKKCFASLFTDRAISYRREKGFDHMKVYLSVGVQRMVNSKASGVMFTLDPDSGFRNVVYINGSWGLGELVVQGRVTPDEFLYFKPTKSVISKKVGSKQMKLVRINGKNKLLKTKENERKIYVLDDKEIKTLAEYGIRIENHYKKPMDIEWAKDINGKLYIVQARPETVYSVKKTEYEEYKLENKSKVLISGRSVGRKIDSGKVKIILNPKDFNKFQKGCVLVTKMTEPDWEPIMKIAAAIVTDKGGTTSHAAIVARELGIPAVIGTENATKILKNDQEVTVDCTSEEGKVWKGKLKFTVKKIDIANLPKTKTKVLVNISVPDSAFNYSSLPVDGVGLARQEFIISSYIRKHPLWMIKQRKAKEYVEKLSYGIAKIAAAFYPREVILRLSDFKTNEYIQLQGGKEFEIEEENPMIGFRGAIRYISKEFEPAFKLECEAIRRVRNEMGIKNIKLMIPFCRTVEEAKKVLKLLKKNGLGKSKDLEIYVMAEIPSNIILAEEFAKLFDGFSIGSNDLTQLILGVGRDNEKLAQEFDERDLAVKLSIKRLIEIAHKYKRKVGICGDAPSKYPEYSEFLIKSGIDSISVTPDMVVKTKLIVYKTEKKI